MKIILRDDVEKLGRCGQVVSVKDGFARNYLIPHKLAIPATVGNLRSINVVSRQRDLRDRKLLRESERIKLRLEKISITAEVQVGEEDKVFGSVTSSHIAELLAEQGFEIDRRDILLDEPLKALGVYTIDVKLGRDVIGKLKVWVVKKADL
ncbi:MAG: 50S ribosomal protein L9 [candidate division Zixibacteria bacterium]|nr:50S ribosomal protein L9 [candidate division Zixibacteria bacterium]